MGERGDCLAQLASEAQVIETLESGRADEPLAPRKPQDVVELADAEIRVHLVGDRPDQLQRKKRDWERDAVRQLDRDDVATLNPDGAQELRAAFNLVLELAVGDATMPVDEGDTVGSAARLRAQDRKGGFLAPFTGGPPALRELGLQDRLKLHAVLLPTRPCLSPLIDPQCRNRAESGSARALDWYDGAAMRSFANLLVLVVGLDFEPELAAVDLEKLGGGRDLLAFRRGAEVLDVDLKADRGVPVGQVSLHRLDARALHQSDHRGGGEHALSSHVLDDKFIVDRRNDLPFKARCERVFGHAFSPLLSTFKSIR